MADPRWLESLSLSGSERRGLPASRRVATAKALSFGNRQVASGCQGRSMESLRSSPLQIGRLLVIVAVLAASFVAMYAVPPASAGPVPPGTFLLQDTDPNDGQTHAYASTIDGTRRWRLTGSDLAEYSPAVSADGSLVAALLDCSCPRSGDVGVFEVGATVPLWSAHVVDPDHSAAAVDWAPDGQTLAVAQIDWTRERGELYTVPAGGGAATSVAEIPGASDIFDITFAPDGSHVALAYATADGYTAAVIELASGAHRVLDLPSFSFSQVAWAVTGDAIRYGGSEPAPAPEGSGQILVTRIYEAALDGTAPVVRFEEQSSAGVVELSPDGEWFIGFDGSFVRHRIDRSVPPAPHEAGWITGWTSADLSPPEAVPTIEAESWTAVVQLGTATTAAVGSSDGSAATIEVDWGDGTVEDAPVDSSPTTISHVYDATGPYDVTVTPLSSGGAVGTPVEHRVYVADIDIAVSPDPVVAGRTAVVDLGASDLPLDVSSVAFSGSPWTLGVEETARLRYDVVFDRPAAGDLTAVVTFTHPEDGAIDVGASVPVEVVADPDAPEVPRGGLLFLRNGNLFVVDDVRAPSPQQVTSYGRDNQASFDETGERIVFQRDNGDIWFVNRDGTGLRPLVQTTAQEATPDLHGDTVVFVRYRQTADGFFSDLIAVDLDDLTTERVLGSSSETDFHYYTPQFSDDGRQIYYATQTTLRRISLDGTGDAELFDHGRNSIYGPDFTADATRAVAYGAEGVFEVGLVAGTTTVLADGYGPSLSPTEDAVAYTVGAGKIWIRPDDGSPAYFVTDGYLHDWSEANERDDSGRRFVVTTIDDPVDDGCNPAPGDCSLPEAIIDNNAVTDPTIDTTIVVPPGSIVTGPLPTITRPVTVIGDLPLDDATGGQAAECGRPSTIRGNDAEARAAGLTIAVGPGAQRPTLVRGLTVVGFDGDAIRVRDSARVRFRCMHAGERSAVGGEYRGNGGDGFDVADSTDVVLYPSVVAMNNRSDALEITGASRRVRNLGGSLSLSGDLGLDLGASGVDPIDPGDADVGPNGLVNRPSIVRSSIDADGRRYVYVRMTHAPRTTPFRLDVFLNPRCDPSGSGEATRWMGAGIFAEGLPDGRDIARLEFTPGVPLHLVTTSVTTGSGTSELSNCLHVDADHDPDVDTSTAIDPTTVVSPTSDDPTDGTSDETSGGGDVGDDGGDDATGGGPVGDDDPGRDGGDVEPGGGTVPEHLGYLMSGPVGEVTVDRPGLLEDVSGDVPLQAIRVDGGDIPADAWRLSADGVVTLDARSLDPGMYVGNFAVLDGDGDRSEPAVIVFLVVDEDGGLPGVTTDPVSRPARPNDDVFRVEPGAILDAGPDRGVLANDLARSDGDLRAELVDAGPLGPRLRVTDDGSTRLDATGLAEGTYLATYRLWARGQDRGTATIRIEVDNDNTCPTVRNDRYQVRAGEQFVVDARNGALANDEDPDGDTITARLVGTFGRKDISFDSTGRITLDARKASPGSHREFRYRGIDPDGEQCGEAVVRLDVVANQPPVANLDYFEVYPGQQFELPARGILGNDLDPDGPESELRAGLVSAPNPWTVSIDPDGAVGVRVPRKASVGDVVEVTYQVKDDLGAKGRGTVRFRVVRRGEHTRIPAPPTATADLHYRVHAGDTLDVPPGAGVLANDRAPDGFEIYAEGVTEGDSSARFAIKRDGSFTADTRLADAGTTFRQRYFTSLKGYAGLRSETVAVTVEVVPPRVSCTAATDGLDAMGRSTEDADTELLTGTVDYTVCHDGLAVTDAWLADAGDPFDFDTSIAMAATDQLFIGSRFTGTNDSDLVDIDLAGRTGTLQLTTEYRVCVDIVDFVTFMFAGLGKLLNTPGLKKVVKSLLAKVDGAPVTWLIKLVEKVVETIEDFPIGATKMLDWLERVPFIGRLARYAADLLRRGGTGVEAFATIVRQGTVRLAWDVGGDEVVEALSIEGAIGRFLDGSVDSFDDFRVVDAIGELFCAVPQWDDASGLLSVRFRADGTIEPQVPPDGGPLGFIDSMVAIAWILDRTRRGDPWVQWEAVDGDRDPLGFRTCDFTRVRPGDRPEAGVSVDGRAVVPCDDVDRRR